MLTDKTFEELRDLADAYWSPICDALNGGGFRHRVSWTEEVSPWGMNLGIPVRGYLEGAAGPLPYRDVEWVEVSTLAVLGKKGPPISFAGFRDMKDELLERVKTTDRPWELLQTTWSHPRFFEEQPVEVVRFGNPFWRTRGPD